MSSTNQRGKNVVSASSGNTTRSQPPLGASCQQRQQPLDDVLAGVGALDRPELGGTDRQHRVCHRGILAWSRGKRSIGSSRVLEVDHLVRTYGPVRALDGMTFRVEPGTVTGFLGPNGAGKTTAMRAVFGLTALDSGIVRFDGHADRASTIAAASATSPRSAASTRR